MEENLKSIDYYQSIVNFTIPRRVEAPKVKWQIGDYIANRYKIYDIVEGGMGILYFCYDFEGREPIAIKTLKEVYLSDLYSIERFRAEALTWIKLGYHKNIVHAKYVLDINNIPYIVMEFIATTERRRSTLREFFRVKRMDLASALDFAIQLCHGMEYATGIVPGLVHRDLKPENILITPDGTPKITDFGLTKVAFDLSSEMGIMGGIVGTLPYMSPEQCLGMKECDTRSDIYSFGIVLYEMLAGKRLFDVKTPSEFVRSHLLIEPTITVPSLPQSVNELVIKCLKKRPEERFQNFVELKEELLNLYFELTGSKYIFHEEKKTIASEKKSLKAQEFLSKGVSLSALGRLEEAITCFDLALEAEPSYSEALYRKGISLMGLGLYEKAIECFNNCLQANQRDFDALDKKGIALASLGRRKEAVVCFDSALSIHPWSYESWYNKGVSLFFLQKYKEAMVCFEKVQSITESKSVSMLLDLCFELISNSENKDKRGDKEWYIS